MFLLKPKYKYYKNMIENQFMTKLLPAESEYLKSLKLIFSINVNLVDDKIVKMD